MYVRMYVYDTIVADVQNGESVLRHIHICIHTCIQEQKLSTVEAMARQNIYTTHTYMHTYRHSYTYIHTRTEAINRRGCGQTECIHRTYIHTCIHTYTHIHTLTYMHACIHTYIHTYTNIHTGTETINHRGRGETECIHRTYIHTYMHTHIHTCIHTGAEAVNRRGCGQTEHAHDGNSVDPCMLHV
jgi:hypothetical protein